MKKLLLLLFLFTSFLSWSQREISGVVKDTDGIPIIGVSVMVKGTKTGVSTDFDGNYKIQITDDKAVLIFSALGMVTQEKTVGNSQKINVVLESDLLQIDEVVVTGYQKVEPNKVATSYTKIDVKAFEKRGVPNIISGVEGLSSALVLSNNPSDPTGSKNFSIRGVSTLSGNSQPLIILDGFQYEGNLSDINPYEVESITLLKDAASASIYGAKSSNGVIVITTKKGKEGKVQVRYTSNLTFEGKTDIEYVMNRASSSDLVDIQHQYATVYDDYVQSYRYLLETGDPEAPNYAGAVNRVYYLYGLKKYGYITEQDFNSQLALLRTYDNTEDIKKLYLQSPIINQQNISISGGSDVFKYRGSLNYTNETGSIKGNSKERILFDFVSNMKFSEKADFDFQVNLTSNKDIYNPVDYNVFNLSGTNNSIFSISSYDRFFDANGNALSVIKPLETGSIDTGGISGGKDPDEIARLISLGLLDESYYPALDFGRYSVTDNSWGARFQGMLNLKLSDNLRASIGGQLSKSSETYENIAMANSWYMQNIINNTTPLTYSGDPKDLNIPWGARMKQTRTESSNYLLRGQLDYSKEFGLHHIDAIIGAEMQEVKSVSTRIDRFGYDVKSGLHTPVDYKRLSIDIPDVYHPGLNLISGGIPFDEGFGEEWNRHISLYSNISYRYDNKYMLYASARTDQSNLFGTDPKYRYRPFWSLAGKWRIGEENFLKNKNAKIDFRVSYGVNGNIANKYGPFDIASKKIIYRAGNTMGLDITSYKINDLRWERTETINFGVDLGIIKNRLDINLDYYRKNTTDILSDIEIDPTLGALYVPKNDASIINDGYEIALSSKNIQTTDFYWETQANFRFNKGKVTQASIDDETYQPHNYSGRILNLKNNEPNSIYVFDYAGVNSNGLGQIRKTDGTLVEIGNTLNPIYAVTFDDLKSAGTTMPKYVASINNNFSYKGISLSLLFIYQGGHITMKDSYDGDFFDETVWLLNSDVQRAWKQAGDENSTDIPRVSSAIAARMIKGSSKNIIPADFIRLRDVVLSYTIPSKYTSRMNIKELTFNVRGGNLWLWTKNNLGIDPETQGLGYRTAPLQKSYTLGVNLIF
ncbi:MAG: SusC/RagA family TonB-linked outer membrane protein [Capnocytophaga sp.]|nr:SusC/RagA family TonB-linked outer membrane protein [Capnocytophaga sp.]